APWPAQRAAWPAKTPHLPAQPAPLPAQMPHLPAQMPHLPAQMPYLPAQMSYLPAQMEHFPLSAIFQLLTVGNLGGQLFAERLQRLIWCSGFRPNTEASWFRREFRSGVKESKPIGGKHDNNYRFRNNHNAQNEHSFPYCDETVLTLPKNTNLSQ
ncbi:MAG: hypothetical protein LBI18_11255, partial [Planctomycetaceae bacterium]|nr:hypothetical protein [Planctomycetaceae bacterium]